MTARLKNVLGKVPAAALLYDAMRPARPRTRYNLEQLAAWLPASLDLAGPAMRRAGGGKKLVLLANLHYWIEQAVAVGLTLRGMGHDVSIAYLPYSNWEKEINAFDLQRQDLYTRRVLAPLDGLVRVTSLLASHPDGALPQPLQEAVQRGSTYDVMYSLQTEEVDPNSALLRLRVQRNTFACQAALQYLRKTKPDVVLIPNGLVTELGIFYQASRFLELPTVTYEFNDQREQIWLAQDQIVMEQDTNDLWRARGSQSLTPEQRTQITAFEEARQGGRVFGKGTRQWQDGPREGIEKIRADLHLDERPVALLATNVLGDSLTLGRNIFAESMAEWIRRTIQYFLQRPDTQLVVRIHPGERLIKGPSLGRVIQEVCPSLPEHIHVVGPHETTNTYDLMELAALGLAYTTTVGMEMSMRGVPVIAAGKTHYRNRGFALSPSSWPEYFGMLDSILGDPQAHRLSAAETEAAWAYGYRFFFEYPFDFPWRLMHLWQDVQVWPIHRVLSGEGLAQFGRAMAHLSGEPIEW